MRELAKCQPVREHAQPVREHAIMQSIRLALGQEPDLVLWRFAPSAPSDDGGRVIRTAPTGIPDLCGILAPSGRWFCLEVKTATGRVRPEQTQWHSLARSRGAFVAVVRSPEEAREALARARNGASE